MADITETWALWSPNVHMSIGSNPMSAQQLQHQQFWVTLRYTPSNLANLVLFSYTLILLETCKRPSSLFSTAKSGVKQTWDKSGTVPEHSYYFNRHSKGAEKDLKMANTTKSKQKDTRCVSPLPVTFILVVPRYKTSRTHPTRLSMCSFSTKHKYQEPPFIPNTLSKTQTDLRRLLPSKRTKDLQTPTPPKVQQKTPEPKY